MRAIAFSVEAVCHSAQRLWREAKHDTVSKYQGGEPLDIWPVAIRTADVIGGAGKHMAIWAIPRKWKLQVSESCSYQNFG